MNELLEDKGIYFQNKYRDCRLVEDVNVLYLYAFSQMDCSSVKKELDTLPSFFS